MITTFRPASHALSPFDLFERELFRVPSRSNEKGSAPTDVWETDTTFELEVDLPGLSEADVNLSVADDVLTLRAERKELAKEGQKAHLRERRPHAFARRFTFGQPIVADEVKASMKNGVLTITVPMAKAQGARQIPVSGA